MGAFMPASLWGTPPHRVDEPGGRSVAERPLHSQDLARRPVRDTSYWAGQEFRSPAGLDPTRPVRRSVP